MSGILSPNGALARMAAQAAQQPTQLAVAQPFNDIQIVAFIAGQQRSDMKPEDAVDRAVELFARSCTMASKIQRRINELTAADQ